MRHGGWWRWLGWGALGLGAALLLVPRRRPTLRLTARPEPETIDTVLEEPQVSWIPGPAGALRTLERHPTAGRAIVFLHGLGGRLEQWAGVLDALGPGLRGLALDLPGHGGSDPAEDGNYSIPALSTAVLATLDAFALRQAVLVGHSLGAAVALEVAARRPERVAGVLLVDPNGDPTRMPAAEREGFLAALRADPRSEMTWAFRQLLTEAPPSIADQVLDDLRDTPGEVLAAAAEAALGYSPVPALESFPGPVAAVVSASNDLPTSLHRLHPQLPTAQLGSLGHWPMLELPEAFCRLLDQFLDDVRARGWAKR